MEQALGLHGFIVAFEDELGEPTGLEFGKLDRGVKQVPEYSHIRLRGTTRRRQPLAP